MEDREKSELQELLSAQVIFKTDGEPAGELLPVENGILGIPVESHRSTDDKMFFRFDDDQWKLMAEFDPNDIDFWKAQPL
jgi:hypothetical protein